MFNMQYDRDDQGSRMPHRIKYANPLRAGRHPFQTYLLALCVISGFPLMLGHVTNTTTDAAPTWVVVYWGASLFFGSAVALAGSYWPLNGYANGLTLEAIGMVLVVPAAVVYAATVLVTVGVNGIVGGCLILGFGLSCYIRARDIYRVLQRARLTAEGAPLPPPATEKGR